MSELSLRPANRQDIDRIYQWRCDPDIYYWSRNQDSPLDWKSHVEWFQSRADDRHDFIIQLRSRPIGVVSIASDGEVGIYIGETDLWGRGAATEALSQAVERMPNRDLYAQIHEDNEASQRLFEKVGFEPSGTDDSWILYQYPR